VVFDYLLQFYWPLVRLKNRQRDILRKKTANRAKFLMRKKVSFALCFLIAGCCLVFAHEIGAQVHLADRINIAFDRLGTEDGLSQAGVTAIAQDQHGFIWIGTQEGLNRYDGYDFETFYHRNDDPRSISHNSIRDVLSDSRGFVWIATDLGVNRFDELTETFETILIEEDPSEDRVSRNRVNVLFEDSSGNLWFGTDFGLVRHSLDGELKYFTNDPAISDSLGGGRIRAIYEDSRQDLWIGTELGGLNLLKTEDGTFERYQHDSTNPLTISGNYVRAIVEDGYGHIWVATFNDGVSILDPTTGQFSRIDHVSNVPISRTRTLLRDHNNRVWIGTDSGLYVYMNGVFTAYTNDVTDPKSLGDNNILELFQDLGGIIWVGAFNGISKWNANIRTFPHIKSDPRVKGGLASNAITSFTEGFDSDVWIGTFEGLSKWDSKKAEFTQFSTREIGLSDERVMSLAQQGEILWVGTMTGGINLLREQTVISTLSHDNEIPSSVSSNAISRIYEDHSGNIWICTYGGGVNKYLGDGRFERFPNILNSDGQFPVLFTLDIVEGQNGLMWIATDGGGVVVLDPETGSTRMIQYDSKNSTSLGSNNVTSLLVVDNVIWIGTRDNGLNLYDISSGEIRHKSRADGLASGAVYGLLEDDEGRIWISGGKGLTVYNPESDSFVRYDSTHGLQSDDFNSGAFLKLSDGSLLFGGNNGFNAFYPNRIKGNDYVPPVRITRFSKFNDVVRLPEPIYKSESIDVDYFESVIGFEFVAMDFTAPEKNRFRYKLEGFDKDWVEVSDKHQVTYTNLDAGNYVFKVVGSNNEGVWNEEGTSIKVGVRPPLWATWWAYLIYLVIGVGLLYRFQKANQARLRREAEKRYSERLQLYIESLEEATDCVVIADANKHLMYANNAIQSLLGLTPSQAIGRSIFSLLFTEPTDASLARTELFEKGRWHGEVKARKGAGFGTMEVTIAAVRDDNDNETAYVSIARDITDRKNTEAELEKYRLNLEQLVGDRTQALSKSLQEKESLLKEVHHRVKNNMQVISSLLNIQAETIGNDVFSGLLGESQQRIKSMSLIHETLYQSEDLLEIDFKDYIDILATSLHRFYAVQGVIVSLDIRVDNVSLDIETAVPCGLIINELISNSFKHAFKGRTGRGTISVSFKNVGCRYVLVISDDGVGLPEGFTLESTASMGMEIVSILTQQLDGKVQYQSENGARFEISFSRKEKDVNEITISG